MLSSNVKNNYMRKILLLLFITVSLSAQMYSQKEYRIENFSEQYYGRVYVENPDIDSEIMIVKIFDKHTQRLLVETQIEADMSYEIGEGDEIESNVFEAPYGKQSLVICDDFNCDGTDDIAIKIGNYSCYGGPAFDIYVNRAGILEKDDILSGLAQEYCGMFEYDCASKEINVMTKSGCCFHIYETYTIAQGKPELRKRVEANGLSYFPVVTITEMKEGKEIVFEKPYWEAMSEEEALFQFKLQNSEKSVVLFLRNEYLLYVFLDKDENIEFMYSRDADQDTSKFQLSEKGNRKELTFNNASAKYTIYESDESIGIEVYTNKKLYNMKGDLESKIGSLSNLKNKEVLNLTGGVSE